MADVEKVRKALSLCSDTETFYVCPGCPYYDVDDCYTVLQKDSLECLEPLTPVKIQTLFSGHFGKRRIVHGKCPVCLTMLNSMDQPNYCSVCGKAVEWDA